MCIGGSPKQPSIPPPAPAAAATPRAVDPTVTSAKRGERKRLRSLAGRSKSIATSALGTTGAANVSGKQLTGQ